MDEYGRFIVKGFKGDVMVYDGGNILMDSLDNASYWDPFASKRKEGDSSSKKKKSQSPLRKPQTGPTLWTPAEITFETLPPKGWLMSISRGEKGTGAKPFTISIDKLSGVELRGPQSADEKFELVTRKPGTQNEFEMRETRGILCLVFKDKIGSIDFVHNSFKVGKAEQWCDTITNILASHRKIVSLKSDAFTQLAKKALNDASARVDVGYGAGFREECPVCSVVLKFSGTELLAGVKSLSKNQQTGVSRIKWRFRLDYAPEVTGQDGNGNVTSFIMHAVALTPAEITIAKSSEGCKKLLADESQVKPIQISIPQSFAGGKQDTPLVGQFVHAFYSLINDYSSESEAKIRGYTSPAAAASFSRRTQREQSSAFMQETPTTIFQADPEPSPRSPLGPGAATTTTTNPSDGGQRDPSPPRAVGPGPVGAQQQPSAGGRGASPSRSTTLATSSTPTRTANQTAAGGGFYTSAQELINQSGRYPQQSWGPSSNPVLNALLRSVQDTEYFTRQLLETQSTEVLMTLRRAARTTGPNAGGAGGSSMFSRSSYLTDPSPNRVKLLGAEAGAAGQSFHPVQQDDGVDPYWKDARGKVAALLKAKKHGTVNFLTHQQFTEFLWETQDLDGPQCDIVWGPLLHIARNLRAISAPKVCR